MECAVSDNGMLTEGIITTILSQEEHTYLYGKTEGNFLHYGRIERYRSAAFGIILEVSSNESM